MLVLQKVLFEEKFSKFSAGRCFGRARRIKRIKNQWMSAEQHCINLGRLGKKEESFTQVVTVSGWNFINE